jgi:hypothetical protein
LTPTFGSLRAGQNIPGKTVKAQRVVVEATGEIGLYYHPEFREKNCRLCRTALLKNMNWHGKTIHLRKATKVEPRQFDLYNLPGISAQSSGIKNTGIAIIDFYKKYKSVVPTSGQ